MNRRKFIVKSAQLGTVVALGFSPVVGCKKSDPCADLSGLTAEEIEDRKSYNYVKETPFPEKKCINCELYIEPEHGSACGGCGLFEGPVHQTGYCKDWVLLES